MFVAHKYIRWTNGDGDGDGDGNEEWLRREKKWKFDWNQNMQRKKKILFMNNNYWIHPLSRGWCTTVFSLYMRALCWCTMNPNDILGEWGMNEMEETNFFSTENLHQLLQFRCAMFHYQLFVYSNPRQFNKQTKLKLKSFCVLRSVYKCAVQLSAE